MPTRPPDRLLPTKDPGFQVRYRNNLPNGEGIEEKESHCMYSRKRNCAVCAVNFFRFEYWNEFLLLSHCWKDSPALSLAPQGHRRGQQGQEAGQGGEECSSSPSLAQ